MDRQDMQLKAMDDVQNKLGSSQIAAMKADMMLYKSSNLYADQVQSDAEKAGKMVGMLTAFTVLASVGGALLGAVASGVGGGLSQVLPQGLKYLPQILGGSVAATGYLGKAAGQMIDSNYNNGNWYRAAISTFNQLGSKMADSAKSAEGSLTKVNEAQAALYSSMRQAQSKV